MVFFVTLPSFGEETTEIILTEDITITDNLDIHYDEMIFPIPIPSNTIDWNIGIFALIGSVMTLIGILLTLRFIYIDGILEKRLQGVNYVIEDTIEREEKSFDSKEYSKDNIRWFAEMLGGFYLTQENLKLRRKANRVYGLKIDLICMISLLIVGLLATLGVFAEEFVALIIIVFILTLLPVYHFARQLSNLNFSFNQ